MAKKDKLPGEHDKDYGTDRTEAAAKGFWRSGEAKREEAREKAKGEGFRFWS